MAKIKKLNRSFYTQPTLKVAKELLGKYIVRKVGNPEGPAAAGSFGAGKKLVGKIIETEAYVGPQDKASHAFRGKVTPRNKAEYLIGGHIYIYLVYGMYWQMNISTYKEGKPECVLTRAIEPIRPIRVGGGSGEGRGLAKGLAKGSLANGPGKLCRYLKLDKSFYGEDLTKSKRIWLEDRGEKIRPSQILATKRIGIDYAGPYWALRKWRFLIKDFQKYLPK